MKSDLIFCSVIFPGKESETNALMLAESIRAFGGKFNRHPVWFAVPENAEPLSVTAQERLRELEIKLVPFPLKQPFPRLFFSEELAGLATMEASAEGECEFLAWMDSNTLLLNEPAEILLPRGKVLGYRPVHHMLIGSRCDARPDAFWTQIYRHCNVQPERIFPMLPVVQDIQMRAYFNAGFLVVKPETGFLRRWQQRFVVLGQSPDFQPFYQQDRRYPIFMHQAVLSGVALSMFDRNEMLELPRTYNYPVHLYDQDGTANRPACIDGLVTIRHEGFYEEEDWITRVPAGEELKQWLNNKLAEIHI